VQPIQEKKQPQRKCIGCGEKKDKKELIRIVRTPTGSVVLDATGKASGRGAYICPSPKCFARVKKAKRLGFALDCQVEEQTYLQLEDQLKDLCQS